MENVEEVFHILEEFSKRKPKTIPQELNEYLAYVARTGDPVYQWALVKSLFKEKLLNVITDFYETTPGIDIPPYPNVDPFKYDTMKNSLLEKLDTFTSAPFTVQRICELLTYPRKQYNRVDKFMRAIEKNILVVSTREPGLQRHIEQENGEPTEPIVNGSDNNSDYNVDVEMEDVSWKENTEQKNAEPQPSSSDSHIGVDNVETCLQTKQDDPMDIQEKCNTSSETVELSVQNVPGNISPEVTETKPSTSLPSDSASPSTEQSTEALKNSIITSQSDIKDVEMKSDEVPNALIIPEIKVDDSEMTEQKLNDSKNSDVCSNEESTSQAKCEDSKSSVEVSQAINEESCLSKTSKEDNIESKVVSEISTSSEESSSSDNTDGNSNSPKTDLESKTDIQVESIESSSSKDTDLPVNHIKTEESCDESSTEKQIVDIPPQVTIQTDNYSISDVNSQIKEIPPETDSESEEIKIESTVDEKTEDEPSKKLELENTDKESPVP